MVTQKEVVDTGLSTTSTTVGNYDMESKWDLPLRTSETEVSVQLQESGERVRLHCRNSSRN